MSVINQMLRDLDQRQADRTSSQPIAPMMGQSKKRSPQLYVIAFVAVLALYAAYNLYSPARDLPSGKASQQSTPAEANPKPTSLPDTNIAETIQPTNTMATNTSEQVQQLDSQAGDTENNQLSQIIATEIEQKPNSGQQKVEAVDDMPRVVKTNPNRSSRETAEALYLKLQSESGAVLQPAQYQEILTIDPSYHQVRIAWFSQLLQSNSPDFERHVRDALASWPEVYQYRQMLARHWVMSEPQQAYDLLLSQMPTIEKAPDYHGLIAYSAQQMGEPGLAIKKYQLLLQHFPERADWWLALALLQEQKGDQARALASFQQSLRFPGLTKTTRDYAEQRVRAIQGY